MVALIHDYVSTDAQQLIPADVGANAPPRLSSAVMRHEAWVMNPKISKIAKSDWPAMAFLMGAAVSLILYFAFPLLHKNLDRNSFFWLSVCGSGLSLTLIGFLWRISRLKLIASSGRVAEGVIEYIQYSRDRGRIEYSFIVEGQSFNSWCPVHLSPEVLSLEQGQKVRVVFDPRSPGKSFIAELFLENA